MSARTSRAIAAPERAEGIPEREFRAIARIVYEETGIVLDESRKALVVGRLGRRLRAHNMSTFKQYLALLGDAEKGPRELGAFINCITTNKTSFFRESHHFRVLADLLRDRAQRAERQPHLRKVRIWSAGCSTGEEPYTIAMTALQALGPGLQGLDLRILATDIDTDVLATARRGIYSREKVGDVPTNASSAFEEITVDGRLAFCVRDELRKLITFERLNFMDESWPVRGPIDFLFCRNVTIYFDRPTQERLYRSFARLLGEEGCLFAGHSENLTWLSDVFTLRGSAVYIPAGRAGSPRIAPSVTLPGTSQVSRADAPLPVTATKVVALLPPVKERIPEAAIQAGGVIASKAPLLVKTTLGSCIAVCLYDPVLRIGGVNHFMLPRSGNESEGSTRFGIHAMEMLINQLLKLGADRSRLVAKIAGACSVVNMTVGESVASKNLRFIEEFLELEGFPIVARRVGGNLGIELRFRTDTGDAFMRRITPTATSRVAEDDASYDRALAQERAPKPSNDPEEGITWFQ